MLLTVGRLLADRAKGVARVSNLEEVEFRVFSQFGDDGIIQWLTGNIDFPNKTFIEFGVEDYRESNTRFLMMNNNWSGLIMDSSADNIARIRRQEYYWRHDLTAKCAFIDRDNVSELISAEGMDREVGILHIDLDGNDYWIWKRIDCICPVVVIMEYNSVFGRDRCITIPYGGDFIRGEAHYSNLYFGSSLPALCHLASRKGYSLVGCNSAGNNAFFVRDDFLNEAVTPVSLEEGYVVSKFREGRNPDGELSFVGGEGRIEAIRGMPVYNVEKDSLEEI